MDSSAPLTYIDPRPIPSPSLGQRGPVSASAPSIGMTPSQIPDHPSSMMDVPRPSNGYRGSTYGDGVGVGGGAVTSGPTQSMMGAPNQQRDVKTLKSHCQYGLREYMSLQRKRQRIDGSSTSTLDLENRLRTQQGTVISDLMFLHSEVRSIVKAAEGNRWRRWIVGGAM